MSLSLPEKGSNEPSRTDVAHSRFCVVMAPQSLVTVLFGGWVILLALLYSSHGTLGIVPLHATCQDCESPGVAATDAVHFSVIVWTSQTEVLKDRRSRLFMARILRVE